MLVSIGRVDGEGSYGPNDVWMAYNRPYLKFGLDDLWVGL